MRWVASGAIDAIWSGVGCRLRGVASGFAVLWRMYNWRLLDALYGGLKVALGCEWWRCVFLGNATTDHRCAFGECNCRLLDAILWDRDV